MQDQVDILLSTYSGAEYIEQQLDSIFAQTHTNFRLIVRDDGSLDNTVELINKYQKRFPDKIIVISNEGKKENVIYSFSTLAEFVDAPYIMFCDQDDVWLPEKISKSLEKIKAMEKEFGDSTPLLVFTDMRIVDKNLKELDQSQWKYLNRNPVKGMQLNHLCMEPVAWGCTMMFNKPLLDIAFPLPSNCMAHDIWVALVAATLGKVDSIKEATMLYRLHGYNLSSFVRYYIPTIIRGFSKSKKDFNSELARRTLQAFVFHRRYSEALPDQYKEVLQQYISVRNHSFPKELYLRIKHGFLFQGFWRNMLLFAMLLRIGRLPKKYQLNV